MKQPEPMRQPEPMQQFESMEEFEKSLMRALRRVDAPETLQPSVMRAAEALRATAATHTNAAMPTQKRRSWRGVWKAASEMFDGPRQWAWAGPLAAVLVVAATVVGGVEHHGHVRRRLQAERDFALSLQITNQALAETRLQLRQAGVELDQQ